MPVTDLQPCGNGYSCYSFHTTHVVTMLVYSALPVLEVKEYRDRSRRRESLLQDVRLGWCDSLCNLQRGNETWMRHEEIPERGGSSNRKHTGIKRSYTESLGGGCDCTAGSEKKIKFPPLHPYSRMERKNEIAQRSRKRHNPELTRQAKLPQPCRVLYSAQQPKRRLHNAAGAPAQQPPGVTTDPGEGMHARTWTSSGALEGRTVPAFQGNQDQFLVNVCVAIRPLPQTSLMLNKKWPTASLGLYDMGMIVLLGVI